MRFLSTFLLLALFSCASVPSIPDFDRVGRLLRSNGNYGTAFPVAYANDGFYVLTCNHVIRGQGEGLTLELDNKTYKGGMVTWTDEESDTALVGFQTEDRPVLYQIAMEAPRRYSRGYAAGYPLGLETLIVGDVMFQGGQTINHLTGPGASGGPVFDENGKVCGIVAQLRTPRTQIQGVHAMFGWVTKMSKLGSVSQKLTDL